MFVDLATEYLGLKLPHPLVAAACPLTGSVESLQRLEDAGAAAAVLPSLFEEQIIHDAWELHRLESVGAESFAEALDFFPEIAERTTGADEYLQLIELAKKGVRMPLIASLNGSSPGGWTKFARRMEEAGADALELNVYFVASNPDDTAADVEARYLDIVASVRDAIAIPLAVKIGPYFSCLPNMVRKLVEAGADGVVLFNRFLQPDLDLESLRVDARMAFSTSQEMRLPLRWIAVLRGQAPVSLAASTGVHHPLDVVKLLLAGADVVTTAAALMERGSQYIGALRDGLRGWMLEHEYKSVQQLRGSMSYINCPDPSGYERANYMRVLTSYSGGAEWR